MGRPPTRGTALGTDASAQAALSEKPLAYSYMRMSTTEQLQGDSARRQLKASERYALEEGLHLVTAMKDIGVSAYRGRNIEFGELRAFLESVELEQIPKGSYLIVESMDRLSRQNAVKAFTLLMDIIQNGVILVTLEDRQKYSLETIVQHQHQLYVALGAMMRAHDESRRKSDLLRAVWGEKKRKAREGVVATRRMPAWLRLDESTGKVEPISDRAEIVQSIFVRTRDGYGTYSIARDLNERDVPTWGPTRKSGGPSVWRESYIKKILLNRAVLGEYQPHRIQDGRYSQKDRIPEGEPIKHYYPQVVDNVLFQQAHSAIATRRKDSAGRKGKTYSNLFTGLLKCGYCNAGYRYYSKGRPPKGRNYLQCSVAFSHGSCQAHAFQYEPFEKALLSLILDLDVDRILNGADAKHKITELQKQEGEQQFELAEISRAERNLMDLVQQAPSISSVFVKEANDLHVRRLTAEQALEETKTAIAEIQDKNPIEHKVRIEALFRAIENAESDNEREEFRRAISQAIRQLIRSISVRWAGHDARELQLEHKDWQNRFGALDTATLKRLIREIGLELGIQYRQGRTEVIDLLSSEILTLKASRRMQDMQDLARLPKPD